MESSGFGEKKSLELILTWGIPFFSFGGIGLAVLMQNLGIIADAGTFVYGCVAGALLLGYLAFLKPKRDIVSLCAPLYALLILIIPMEMPPTLLLQVLFAASITILTIRLNRKFGSSDNFPGGTDPMERFLITYIDRIRPHFSALPEKTGHELASAFLAFKFGLYANAVRGCETVLPLLPSDEAGTALKKAVSIVRENAQDLNNSQVVPDLSLGFSESELSFVAINLPPETIEDPATLALDNAIVMLYATAMICSPEDEEPLEEHRKFILRLLTGYKKSLGIS